MSQMDSKIFDELSVAKKNKTVLTGTVVMVQGKPGSNDTELIVDYKTVKCVMPRKEIDASVRFKSLVSFMGSEIPFIVKSISKEDNSCVVSRADVQRTKAPDILDKLEDGECFDGRVINVLKYGAYVDIDGVAGLMKNADFADDMTAVREILHVGDKIKVKLRGKSSNGTLLFEAVKKYVSPSAIRKEDLEVGQIVLGVVRSIQPFGIFVNVAPGLDALVESEYVEVEEDQKVSVKIKVIKQDGDKLRVRGKIVAVL